MKTALVGKWRILEMERWDQGFVDVGEPGRIVFERKGTGHFHFGYVQT